MATRLHQLSGHLLLALQTVFALVLGHLQVKLKLLKFSLRWLCPSHS